MTDPVALTLDPIDLDAIAAAPGVVAVVLGADGKMGRGASRVNRLTKGALKRFGTSEAFAKMKPGDSHSLGWPTGLEASALLVLRLNRRSDVEAVRKAGAALGAALGKEGGLAIAERTPHLAEFCLAARLRAYRFTEHLSDKGTAPGPLRVMVSDPEATALEVTDGDALAAGVFFTRDLVSEPANVLTTTEFASRLEGLRDLGVSVEVLEEDRLAELGMNALLGVGQGSRSPSKVVVMEWRGGADTAPLAFVGKGVVFDTGGISIKPAGGMEEMTMDMGGAGVVAGLMKAVAMRKARSNIVGVVGLVENMPDGNAQRPGDIVRSMKGDTIEVINTDAEGRLVLADILWYTADRFQPRGMVNLATLTGAIIVALGHENAGVFSNDDTFAGAFLKAAAATGEGAWRMPLGAGYDKLIKSNLADMKNVGGRPAGSITAAQFLQRFVKEGTPWIHLDIAGVALVKTGTTLSPKGATGWGVRALDRLVRDLGEG